MAKRKKTLQDRNLNHWNKKLKNHVQMFIKAVYLILFFIGE